MPVAKLPLVGPLYANIDEINLPGAFAPVMYNAYLTEAGSIARFPGLSQWVNLSNQPVNGLFWWENQTAFVAGSNAKLYKLTDSAGNKTDVTGSVTLGVQRLDFADYRDPNYGDICFVADGGKIKFLSKSTSTVTHSAVNYTCKKMHQASAATEPGVGANWTDYWTASGAGGSGWVSGTYYTSGVLEEIADADAPQSVSFVTVIDRYLVALADDTDQLWYSDVANWQSWSGEFVTAEGRSDNVVAMDSGWGQIVALGSSSFQRFENDGVTPWVVNKPATVEAGSPAKYSLLKFDNAWWFLDQDRTFVKVVGVTPQVMSKALNKILGGITNLTDAVTSACVIEGRPFVFLQLPSEGRTFVYDASVPDSWTELGDFALGAYEKWRCTNVVYSPAWNIVVGAGDDGKLYKLSSDYATNAGDTLRVERRTGPVDHGTLQRKVCHEVTLKLKRTSRAAEDADYTLLVDWRDNGSATWSNAREVSLTKVGDTDYIARLHRLGQYRTRQWRLVVSDAATSFALVDAEERFS